MHAKLVPSTKGDFERERQGSREGNLKDVLRHVIGKTSDADGNAGASYERSSGPFQKQKHDVTQMEMEKLGFSPVSNENANRRGVKDVKIGNVLDPCDHAHDSGLAVSIDDEDVLPRRRKAAELERNQCGLDEELPSHPPAESEIVALRGEFRRRLYELEQTLRAEFDMKLERLHGSTGPAVNNCLASYAATPAQSAEAASNAQLPAALAQSTVTGASAEQQTAATGNLLGQLPNDRASRIGMRGIGLARAEALEVRLARVEARLARLDFALKLGEIEDTYLAKVEAAVPSSQGSAAQEREMNLDARLEQLEMNADQHLKDVVALKSLHAVARLLPMLSAGAGAVAMQPNQTAPDAARATHGTGSEIQF